MRENYEGRIGNLVEKKSKRIGKGGKEDKITKEKREIRVGMRKKDK